MANIFDIIVDSQEFAPDDRLTKMINQYSDDEVALEELDMVMAAGKADYQEFLKKINETKKD